jgi:5-formyltetrahydrofolate cyclo-ligase
MPDAGARLADAFPPELDLAPGVAVSGYWPFRSEIDPRPLMRALAQRGCRLALPVTPPRGSDAAMTFRQWSPGDALEPGGFRVPEPLADAALLQPDIVLCPLLAFDRFGARLGYGQGHYDRALAGLRAVKPVIVLGLGFASQEVERLPAEAHDIPLHGIVTETGYMPVMENQA